MSDQKARDLVASLRATRSAEAIEAEAEARAREVLARGTPGQQDSRYELAAGDRAGLAARLGRAPTRDELRALEHRIRQRLTDAARAWRL